LDINRGLFEGCAILLMLDWNGQQLEVLVLHHRNYWGSYR
jgi:hypothetical protein